MPIIFGCIFGFVVWSLMRYLVLGTSNTVAYLFKNSDPHGSLSANFSNLTARCRSHMLLAETSPGTHGSGGRAA